MMPAGGFTQAFGGWAGPKLECVEFPAGEAPGARMGSKLEGVVFPAFGASLAGPPSEASLAALAGRAISAPLAGRASLRTPAQCGVFV